MIHYTSKSKSIPRFDNTFFLSVSGAWALYGPVIAMRKRAQLDNNGIMTAMNEE